MRKVPGFCAWGLRHLVFKTKWIALGYLEYNGFRQLQRYPLQLTQGDVEENITDLLATVETLDSETEKIKVCASVDRVQAIDGVQMMAHMACSTGLSEKGHGPGTNLRKHHSRIETSLFRLQSFVHLNLPLFIHAGGTKAVQKLQSRLDDMCSVDFCFVSTVFGEFPVFKRLVFAQR